ncbi:MAG: hypothetical protein PSU94_15465 [Lacunisphaera sp.]|nr:hypothetical protein [Lacunisphaera sp.]
MIRLLQIRYDKLLFALAAALAAASCLWLWRQQGDIRRLHALPVAASLAGAAYEPAGLHLPETKAAAWPKAPAQSHGSGWLYEVFTPPVIYYNTLARSFTVTPPMYPGETNTPFGLELLAVKQEQFRLQLVGYFGAPGDYLAAFTSSRQPETLLARAGRHFEGLGLILKSFDVRKITVVHNDPWPVYDIAALAVLTDEETGADVVLDSRARKFTDTPLAVLQALTGGPRREVREGDTFDDENSTYRIERIQLDPPEVVVARTTSGLPQPETKILHPAAKSGGIAGKATKPKPLSARPARAMAASGD